MSSSRILRRPLVALLALAVGLSWAGLASAAASRIVRPLTDAPAPPPAAPTPTSPQGSRVIPVPPGASDPMRETSPGVYEGIVPIRLPDGSWRVDLDERFHAFTVVRSTGFGLAGACLHSAAGLAQWRAALSAGASSSSCAHEQSARAPSRVRPTVTSPAGTTLTKWEDR